MHVTNVISEYLTLASRLRSIGSGEIIEYCVVRGAYLRYLGSLPWF